MGDGDRFDYITEFATVNLTESQKEALRKSASIKNRVVRWSLINIALVLSFIGAVILSGGNSGLRLTITVVSITTVILCYWHIFGYSIDRKMLYLNNLSNTEDIFKLQIAPNNIVLTSVDCEGHNLKITKLTGMKIVQKVDITIPVLNISKYRLELPYTDEYGIYVED